MKANYRSMRIGAAVIALALWIIPSRLAFAGEAAKEEKVTLDQVPAKVRATLERECKGATIRDIVKEVEGEKTLYDFEVTKGGRAFEFDITADGEVVSREEQVELSGVPAAVRQTLERASKGGKLGTIMKVNEEGKTSYEAEIASKGKTAEVSIAADGKLIKEGAEEEKEAVSEKKAERKETKGKEGKAERKEAKGKEAKTERKEVKKKEAKEEKKEEGQEKKVALAQLPRAVRATLLRASKGGEIEEITKETEEGKVVYSAEVELKVEIEIAANGKLIKKAVEDEEDEEGKEKGDRKALKGEKKEGKEKGERAKIAKKSAKDDDEEQSQGKTERKKEGKKIGEREGKEKKRGWFSSLFHWGGHGKKGHERD